MFSEVVGTSLLDVQSNRFKSLVKCMSVFKKKTGFQFFLFRTTIDRGLSKCNHKPKRKKFNKCVVSVGNNLRLLPAVIMDDKKYFSFANSG